MEGLSSSRPRENDDPVSRRIHPSLSLPCTACWFAAHPLLRFPWQSKPAGEAGALPTVARHATDCSTADSRTGLSRPLRRSCRLFPAPVSPLPARRDGAGGHTAEVSVCLPGRHRFLMTHPLRNPNSFSNGLAVPVRTESLGHTCFAPRLGLAAAGINLPARRLQQPLSGSRWPGHRSSRPASTRRNPSRLHSIPIARSFRVAA